MQGRDRLLRVSDSTFVYVRCQSCGAAFQSAPPSPKEIGKYYPTDYGPYTNVQTVVKPPGFWNKTVKKLLRAGSRSVQRRLNSLYQPSAPGSTLLDYGCGSDKVLTESKRKGWQTLGVDFSPDVVNKVQAAGHAAYLATEDVWKKIPDDSITLIRMNHVIEHLYDPEEVLRHLLRKLKPGGKLHLATPNPAGLSARMFRSRWLGLDCPRHIVLFPPQPLVRHLKEIGFGPVELLPEFVTKDVARSAGFFLIDLDWMKHDRNAALVDQPFVSAILALPCFLATKIGWCDRYHVIAHKT